MIDAPVSVDAGTVVVRATHNVPIAGAESGRNKQFTITERPHVVNAPITPLPQ